MPRRRSREESSSPLDRWVISWADFLTLLFAFFVVMYAISSVNEDKYKSLAQAMTGIFSGGIDNNARMPVEGGTGLLNGGKTIEQAPAVQAEPPKSEETELLNALEAKLQADFSAPEYQGQVEVSGNDLWMTIELRSNMLFESGSAVPSIGADGILTKIAATLRGYKNPIHVEGFTDSEPINTERYPSNWELSAARAATVVRLLASFGVEPDRMAAVGYGEYQPQYSNRTERGRQLNRRILIVVARDRKVRRAVEAFGSERVSADAVNKILSEPDPQQTAPTLEQVNKKNGVLFRQATPESSQE